MSSNSRPSHLINFALLLISLIGGVHFSVSARAETLTEQDLKRACLEELNGLPGINEKKANESLCTQVRQLDSCWSEQKRPIYHFDSIAAQPALQASQRILVFGVIHGDEAEGGTVARQWMKRLTELQSRNSWRIVPILNPDGMRLQTRTNANGVDINRNFPSQDWDQLALKMWKAKKGKDPRRFPGKAPGSEKETNCALAQIRAFQPDFMIAIHTPYGILDYDGPKVYFPNFKHLPWVRFGTFPGSLGRYMWEDKGTPVLTVELKNDKILENLDDVHDLQDISGTLAIRAQRKLSQQDSSKHKGH